MQKNELERQNEIACRDMQTNHAAAVKALQTKLEEERSSKDRLRVDLDSEVERLKEQLADAQKSALTSSADSDAERNKFEALKLEHGKILAEVKDLRNAQKSSRDRELALMREVTGVRNHLESMEKKLVDADARVLESDTQRMDSVQALEDELASARRTIDILRGQISEAHSREDHLRSDLEAMKTQIAGVDKSEQTEREIRQLAAFKKELADVRAKQEFAVNEVKYLMAKLAMYEDTGKTPAGSKNLQGDGVGGTQQQQKQQMNVIDTNLKRLQERRGKSKIKGRRRQRR